MDLQRWIYNTMFNGYDVCNSSRKKHTKAKTALACHLVACNDHRQLRAWVLIWQTSSLPFDPNDQYEADARFVHTGSTLCDYTGLS